MSLYEYLQQPWLYYTLLATYALSIFTVIAVIIGENRNPVRSLAWVTILLLLPAVGLVLYFFFGRNVRNKRVLSRRNKRRLRKALEQPGQHRVPKNLSAQAKQLSILATALDNSRHLDGNNVEVFSSGAEKFQALKQDLLSARQSINLQYYIFDDDDIGNEIAEILKQKAAEGVKVRVIYDHVGSFHTKSSFFNNLRKAGVEIHPFFRVSFPLLGAKMNWRNHRKIVVIDGSIGYIGGMNIANRYIQGDSWRDCHLRITGPSVSSLQYSFASDWCFMGNDLLDDEVSQLESMGSVGMQFISGGPLNHWNNLAHIFMQAISSATKRVWIQTPYFLPPDHLLRSLQNVALSGVDVRIMMPRHSDAVILGLASRSYVSECFRAGIKIYFYEPGMLHSKVLIIDDDIATVGSTNFDFRSFEHNFEANVIIYSAEVNSRLREVFMSDQRLCTRILADVWRKRPLLQRSSESFLRLFSPIL